MELFLYWSPFETDKFSENKFGSMFITTVYHCPTRRGF